MANDIWINDEASSRDAEKRWHDPQAFRAAAKYVAFVITLAAAAFAATVAWRSLLAGILVPGILLVGTLGALMHTYQVWRDGGVWVIWQGAAWILVILFMFCLGVPTAVM